MFKSVLATIAVIGLFIGVESALVRGAVADDEVAAAVSADEGSSCMDLTVCSGNFVPDSKICGCSCSITSCNDPEEIFNPTTCSCRKEGQPNPACANVSCPDGWDIDPDNCKCVMSVKSTEASR